MNPAANNSVIGTQVLHTLGLPECNNANNNEDPASAIHLLLVESIILLKTDEMIKSISIYQLNIIKVFYMINIY